MERPEYEVLDLEQAGADLKRVEQARNHLEHVYVEMEPGDVLLSYCNTLHRFDQNRSPHRRWAIICCYNAARNDPCIEHHHPCYTQLKRVPDGALMSAGLTFGSRDHGESLFSEINCSGGAHPDCDAS